LQLSNLRFLVVEDHDVQRRLLMQILANLGATSVQGAEDGNVALGILGRADRPIDIMITDLSMPGMDGMELIRHVSEGGSGVSIILSSSLEPKLLVSVATMAQAYKVKLLGVMNKPPSAVKLSRLIQQYMLGKASSTEPAAEFTLAEIAEAFAGDEFEPFFQPTVSLANLRVKGFEAIPHWRHPKRGPLAADAFLPAIKTYGLGDDLVWSMLRKCAAHCRTWRDAGLDVKVFLKLALGSLTDPHLASKIEKVVLEERAQPGDLVLGIVENAVDVSAARALENMVRLRMQGFDLAIDEFGTGSIGAEQLARVAFNELKITRNLVGNGNKPLWAGLAEALDMAEQLKLLAVADGITTPDDWNLLQEWKCNFGQGPLISRPLQAASVGGWLKRWPPKPRRGVWTPAPVL
jgi:EAL domain-containing protein (putative c-di-GMP-specific phosphodiesterase class I)/FixJ family two-component response regulator